MTNRTRVQVKLINLEPFRLAQSELLAAFPRAAERYHYHDDIVSRRVFDFIWQWTSTEYGDIEGLIESISSDERQFGAMCKMFVRARRRPGALRPRLT